MTLSDLVFFSLICYALNDLNNSDDDNISVHHKEVVGI